MYEDAHLEASYEARTDYDTFGYNDGPDWDLRDFDDFDNDENECEGHESLNGGDMGVTRYCDGSCVASPAPLRSDSTQIHHAANGHTMRYRVKPNGDLSQHDATCVYDCRACQNGDQRPDW